MTRYLPLLAPCLLVTIYGCGGGSAASTFEEQTKAYNACVTEQSSTLGATSTASNAPQGPFTARLDATDVPNLSRLMRDGLKASSRQSLDSARIATVAALRCASLKPAPVNGGYTDAGASYASGAEDSSPTAATQASGTNNQAAGIDEADFVKNDTKYIYVVEGGHFRILDAFPGSSMHQIADVTVPGTAKKLFVEGNRALVYSSVPRTSTTANGGGYRVRPPRSARADEAR